MSKRPKFGRSFTDYGQLCTITLVLKVASYPRIEFLTGKRMRYVLLAHLSLLKACISVHFEVNWQYGPIFFRSFLNRSFKSGFSVCIYVSQFVHNLKTNCWQMSSRAKRKPLLFRFALYVVFFIIDYPYHFTFFS